MVTNILLVLLILWGIPSTYFRSKFRKIVYQTNDWKINIKPLFKKEIMGLFQDIHKKGNTIIIVTHEENIARYAKRIIRLKDGEIESDEINKSLKK